MNEDEYYLERETSKITLNLEKLVIRHLQGKVFHLCKRHKRNYSSQIVNTSETLKEAQEYAKNGGYVASLPDILQARIISKERILGQPINTLSIDTFYKDDTFCITNQGIWEDFCTSSEEYAVKSNQGGHFAIVIHGGGFVTPERLLETPPKVIGSKLIKITNKESHMLLAGKLPDGEEIPVIRLKYFLEKYDTLPKRYAVVLDFDAAKQSKSGYFDIDNFRDDTLFIVRAGGPKLANAYLNKIATSYSNKIGIWHFFGKELEMSIGNLLSVERKGWTKVNERDCPAYRDISSNRSAFDGRYLAVSKADIKNSENNFIEKFI